MLALQTDVKDRRSMTQERASMKSIPFLTVGKTRSIHREFGTPVFVYDQRTLEHQARLALGFPNAFGLTARRRKFFSVNCLSIKLRAGDGYPC